MLRLPPAAWMLFFYAVSGSAAVSPWMPFDRQADWRQIDGMSADIALRIEMIRKAERSVDLIVYDQRCDYEFVLPVLSALRDAANRGVKVRFITSWGGQILFDHCGVSSTHRYLVDTPTATPTVPSSPVVERTNNRDASLVCAWTWMLPVESVLPAESTAPGMTSTIEVELTTATPTEPATVLTPVASATTLTVLLTVASNVILWPVLLVPESRISAVSLSRPIEMAAPFDVANQSRPRPSRAHTG